MADCSSSSIVSLGSVCECADALGRKALKAPWCCPEQRWQLRGKPGRGCNTRSGPVDPVALVLRVHLEVQAGRRSHVRLPCLADPYQVDQEDLQHNHHYMKCQYISNVKKLYIENQNMVREKERANVHRDKEGIICHLCIVILYTHTRESDMFYMLFLFFTLRKVKTKGKRVT